MSRCLSVIKARISPAGGSLLVSRNTMRFAVDPVVVSKSARAGYERFRQGKTVGNIRREIVDSWTRSVEAGVNPDGQEPPRLHTPLEVSELRQAHPMSPFVPMISGFLEHVLQDESQVFVITDARGEILWRFGSRKALRTADATGFREGVGWAEGDVGTNAIGVAIATLRPTSVFSAEHYVENQHEWVCMAAPILDPETSAMLGVLNLSGPFTRSSGEAMSFVQCAASLVQEKLRFERRESDDAAIQALTRVSRNLSGKALVSPGGRFVHGDPLLAGQIQQGCRTGSRGFQFANGTTIDGETRGDYLLVEVESDQWAAHRGIELAFLGPNEPTLTVNGNRTAVTVRRAEILYLLAVNPNGLSAEEIAMRIYGDDGLAGTARSEMHRIRASMRDVISSHPYRFAEAHKVAGDFVRVKALLRDGNLAAALSAYTGPLLPRAKSFEVELAREELHDALRRQLLASPATTLLRAWVNSDLGSSDTAAISALIEQLPDSAPESAMLQARLAVIDRALGVDF